MKIALEQAINERWGDKLKWRTSGLLHREDHNYFPAYRCKVQPPSSG